MASDEARRKAGPTPRAIEDGVNAAAEVVSAAMRADTNFIVNSVVVDCLTMFLRAFEKGLRRLMVWKQANLFFTSS
jgi:hypothetical protein